MPLRRVLMVGFMLTGVFAVITAGQSNPADAFYPAIRANDLARLNAVLAQGANVNGKDNQGITPLMFAAWVGSPEAMTALLDHGADPNLTNSAGSTALMMSVTELPKVRLLIARKADVMRHWGIPTALPERPT